jgi:putative selenium metabolism protein SsnA
VSYTLSGGTVLRSLGAPHLDTADVEIEGDRILSVGAPSSGGSRRDCSGCLVIPGNICAHTHLYSSLARGMPFSLEPPTDFLSILQRIWWRLDRGLDEGSIRASALVAAAEAALAGTTTLVDHHSSPRAIDGSLDIIADALAEIGLRSVLCYETSDRDGDVSANAGLRENERFLEAQRPLARGMVGAHASFTLSEETLSGCVDVSRRTGAGIHIHAAEDLADQSDAVSRFGTRVIQRLDRAGALTDDGLLAHCVHVDPAELELVRRSSVTVAHNPTSNMNNSVGRAPVGDLGSRVALGTDGIGGDMFAASTVAHLRRREDDPLTGAGSAIDLLARGAAFVGRTFDEPGLGTNEPGAPADLVVLDYLPPTPLNARNFGDHWIFGIGAKDVRDVFVAGQLVVDERRLANADHRELLDQASAQATRLWDRLDDIGPHPFQPGVGDTAT